MIFKKGLLEIRDTVVDDLESIKDRLLDCDVVEIRQEHGMDPYQALLSAHARSPLCSTVLYDGLPVLVFGLVPDPDRKHCANGWMLVTKQMAAMKLTFLKMSKRVILDMLDHYPIIWNYIHAKHHAVIAWLKWCGATLTEPQPLDGRRMFVLKRSDYV